MRKRDLSKGIVLLLALTIVLSTFVQSWVPVQAEDEIKTFEPPIVFNAHKDSQRGKRVNIPDIFEVESATVDNGRVEYEVYGGGNVGITVLEGVKTKVLRPAKTEVWFPDINTSDTTDISFIDKDSGLTYSGKLPKVGTPIPAGSPAPTPVGDSSTPTSVISSPVPDTIVVKSSAISSGGYYQIYEGLLENSEAYRYEVTIKYKVNKLPVVEVSAPKNDSYVTKELKVEGTVKDENIGDMLGVYYSIDPENIMEGTLKTDIKSDGSNQPFNGSINLDLTKVNDGRHALYIWGLDRNGTKPAPVEIPFFVDNTPPKDPNFTLDPEGSTKESVTVGVHYTDTDIVTKEFRVNGGEWEPLGDNIIMDKNGTIETKATDRAGNFTISSKIITNIDKDAPKEPKFEFSTTEDTNQSVTVWVHYDDTDTDIVTKEYRVDEGEWKPLDGTITMDKNGVIETRATDKVGNSTTSSREITNIDKNKPTAPSIAVSDSETVSKPITVTITPGEDKETGIKTTEYCLSGATTGEWKVYEAPFTVKNIGSTEISARSIDKVGNISDTTKKTVTIKSPGNGGNTGDGGGGTTIPSGGGEAVSPAGTPAPTPTPVVVQHSPGNPGGAGLKADVAVYLTSDKTTYGENETINFSINYKNKSSVNADGTTVTVDIPQYTTVAEISGGTVKGSKIEWPVGNLAGGASGEIKFKVKVGLLDKAEVEINNKAAISSTTLLDNTADDESLYRLMLYSNRYDKKSHQLYVKGYNDNTFKPENSITRAEVAAMLVRVLNLGEGTPDKITYKDFTEKHWAYGYIYSATKSGLFEGYSDNSFKPDDYITRAELSTALARYLKLKNIEPMEIHFSDLTDHWAKNYIEEIYRLKLIEGYKDGKFLPNSQIKRCETVTIINRMLFRGPLKGADASFTDVKKDHWAYGHIVESCMDHYYTRNADSSETKVNKDN